MSLIVSQSVAPAPARTSNAARREGELSIVDAGALPRRGSGRRIDGRAQHPVLVVDLNAIEDLTYAEMVRVVHAAERPGGQILIGVRSKPLPKEYTGPGWWIVEAMSTTIVPVSEGAIFRDAVDSPISHAASLVAVEDPEAVVAGSDDGYARRPPLR